ncbi:HigA family addiction module antitoxin [Christiangramia echinicola]|uniref:HigA family addiction module antitoxin n=1 Tax=Christiangramia echinicola TaxID=279359 RepID=UPI0003F55DB0|nr:HigA family addiction module antitoxin [Christiangramia echinicola]
MFPETHKIAGIHPGLILKREMEKRNMKNVELASSLNEHAQTIGAIIKGKRKINPQLSIKLGDSFHIAPDYFMQLQASYDVKKIQSKQSQKTPNLKILRKILFWDTDIETIDWNKYKDAVIQRVFQRGNEQEKKEIIRFYGSKIVQDSLNKNDNSYYTIF